MHLKIQNILFIIFLILLISCKKENTSNNIENYENSSYLKTNFSDSLNIKINNQDVEPKKVKEINVINEYITQTNNIKRKNRPEFMQGLYITAYRTRGNSFEDLLVNAKNSGINTIVFDLKEMQGDVYFSIKDYPQLQFTSSEPIININRLVEQIHSHGFYAVARLVQFYNISTAKKFPELQATHINGGYWNERENTPTWLDPSNPVVQSELLHIIDIVASSNVDEIQLDYVRFPTEGRLSNAVFYFEKIDEQRSIEDSLYIKREKRDIIRDYVRDVREVCDRHNVKLSADIFAIVAWQRKVDIRNTGQDIAYISPYLHNIHPMIYSSHFSDDFQFHTKDFIDKPYAIVKAGLEKTIRHSDSKSRIIPYLQAFGWRVNYNQEYMFDQLKATIESGSKGYILWNAGSSYNKALKWIKEWNIAREKGIILEGYHKNLKNYELDTDSLVTNNLYE